jgi:hypothetical protein
MEGRRVGEGEDLTRKNPMGEEDYFCGRIIFGGGRIILGG